MRTYECNWCGMSFETDHKRKYCSDDCRLKANGKRYRKKKLAKELSSVENLAREAGMTYGQYVAKYGL